MTFEDCQRLLKRAEEEWGRCRNELDAARRLVDECAELELEVKKLAEENASLRAELEDLRRENASLKVFRAKVRHPDFWGESVAYPLARRLRDWARALAEPGPVGPPAPDAWARRVLELAKPSPDREARRELEALLLALWHWLRLEEVRAALED